MKIFITGASGFIGNYLLDLLISKGHDCICLSHNTPINKEGVEIVKGSITNMESMERMKECDAVFANAAIAMAGPPKDIRKKMWEVNVKGTQNTLELALKYGIKKIIYTSSIVALGDTKYIGIADETSINKHCGSFASLYEKTKYEAHLIAQKFINENDAPITIAMPAIIFGEYDKNVIGTFFHQLAKGGFNIMSKVPTKMNFNHVQDLVEGFLLCLEKGKKGPYILSGPVENNLSVSKLIEMAARLGNLKKPNLYFGKKMLTFGEKLYRIRGLLTRKWQSINKESIATSLINFEVTNEKAVRELGYSPKPIEERVKQTIEWYKNNI
jgi:dihydroflavonol-4-reductase